MESFWQHFTMQQPSKPLITANKNSIIILLLSLLKSLNALTNGLLGVLCSVHLDYFTVHLINF